jgi:hypothetical protein
MVGVAHRHGMTSCADQLVITDLRVWVRKDLMAGSLMPPSTQTPGG